jgi:BNR/Asp-box repeat
MSFCKEFRMFGAAALATFTLLFAERLEASDVVSMAQLQQQTHVHGLTVDRQDPSRLLIATHHGLFRTRPDGKAERISEVQDFMGFNPHPGDPNTLYASGHPSTGGNLGFIASSDQGNTWKQISPGVNGPVDFHQMSVSPADPSTIYGSYQGLQISQDGGKSWKVVGPAPAKLIDLAASANNVGMSYAATEAGLLVSSDAGRSWKPLIEGAPVTLVEVTPDGMLYAYVVGRGLVHTKEGSPQFETVGNDIGGGFLIHLAADPTTPNRLFAATGKGRILSSTDQGRTWKAFSGSDREGPSR